MTFRAPLRPLLVCALAAPWLGCVAEVSTDVAACVSDADCPEGLACNGGGACVEPSDGCQTDLDCADDERCTDGACVPRDDGAMLCADTSECPVTHACENGACAPLGDGACRLSGQCPSSAPLCDTPSPNDVGACVGAPEPECPEHASLVDGTDDCRCDDGYAPTDDATACLPVRATDPPPADEPPPQQPPPQEPPPQEPPPQEPPPDEPPPDAPADCPANSSTHPDDPSMCMCDPLYVPNESGTACVDECEELGWYGDGFYCDFCAWPDPDCF